MSSVPSPQVLMMADVSGSAALFERLGDTEALHAVDRCLKRMSRSIEGYQGKTIQIVGDELVAAFGTAEDACLAAIDMQQRIADLPPVSGLKLCIRIGLHSGEVAEVEGKLSGIAVNTTARIAGLARRKEILCSSTLLDQLMPHTLVHSAPITDLANIEEEGKPLALHRIHWLDHDVSIYPHSTFGSAKSQPAAKLELRFRDKTFQVDPVDSVLTIGRDLGNKLVIEDRKASRLHARIEHRPDGFHLIDTSTNGTFISSPGRPEFAIRKKDIRLEGRGQLGFGGSIRDPEINQIEFEMI